MAGGGGGGGGSGDLRSALEFLDFEGGGVSFCPCGQMGAGRCHSWLGLAPGAGAMERDACREAGRGLRQKRGSGFLELPPS